MNDCCILILGNQLFPISILSTKLQFLENPIFFMREDFELCTYYKFHKHKIVLFLASMREYSEALKQAGFVVHYEKLKQSSKTYELHFLEFLKFNKISKVFFFEIEDKFFEKRILSFLEQNSISYTIWESPMFLCSRKEFQKYLKSTKRPFMKTFYERERKRLNILVNEQEEPLFNKWSFDTENRKALPKNKIPPALPVFYKSQILLEVENLVEKEFPNHIGKSKNFYLPVTLNQTKIWLKNFLETRLENFGAYQDALSQNTFSLYHSLLSPMMNLGLITPHEVINETLKYTQQVSTSISSLEGFIRQIIGWREYVRGIYQNFSEIQESTNFFNASNKLSRKWYEGETGIPPLDAMIQKLKQYAYAHHIERLMVASSLMILLEVHPFECYRWFMEMFVDSSDWVMMPNVFGMGIFSDGGLMATKPYFCSSNYYRKMGNYKPAEWCNGIDGLYWEFIEKNKAYFLKNPRTQMMVKLLEKMDQTKKQNLFRKANKLRKLLLL